MKTGYFQPIIQTQDAWDADDEVYQKFTLMLVSDGAYEGKFKLANGTQTFAQMGDAQYYSPGAAGAAEWGGIAGILSAQTDLAAALDSKVDKAGQPKVYKAILNQTGTDAPVATVLVNTLGGTVVWGRGNVGSYIGTLVAAFQGNKTIVLSTGNSDPSAGISSSCTRGTDDAIQVSSFDSDAPADDMLSGFGISIEVYP